MVTFRPLCALATVVLLPVMTVAVPGQTVQAQPARAERANRQPVEDAIREELAVETQATQSETLRLLKELNAERDAKITRQKNRDKARPWTLAIVVLSLFSSFLLGGYLLLRWMGQRTRNLARASVTVTPPSDPFWYLKSSRKTEPANDTTPDTGIDNDHRPA